jgi:hypothetical protein
MGAKPHILHVVAIIIEREESSKSLTLQSHYQKWTRFFLNGRMG